MAIDTREKRASCTNLFTPLPLADSTITVADRAQVSWVFLVEFQGHPMIRRWGTIPFMGGALVRGGQGGMA